MCSDVYTVHQEGAKPGRNVQTQMISQKILPNIQPRRSNSNLKHFFSRIVEGWMDKSHLILRGQHYLETIIKDH